MVEIKNKSNPPAPSGGLFDKLFNRRRILVNLDGFQDILVVILMFALLVHMSLLLVTIFLHLSSNPEFKTIAKDMLSMLILIEIFRLMAIYLETHHIPIREAVEVTLISVLREVIVIGIIYIKPVMVACICAFLLFNGILLYLDAVAIAKIRGAGGSGHGHDGHH